MNCPLRGLERVGYDFQILGLSVNLGDNDYDADGNDCNEYQGLNNLYVSSGRLSDEE